MPQYESVDYSDKLVDHDAINSITVVIIITNIIVCIVCGKTAFNVIMDIPFYEIFNIIN